MTALLPVKVEAGANARLLTGENACVSDMGEQETWAGAIDPQPTSSHHR